MKDHITVTFKDGSAQVDYAVTSKNSLLLALTIIEGLCVQETQLPIEDIRLIIDEEKQKLEAKDTKVIDSES